MILLSSAITSAFDAFLRSHGEDILCAVPPAGVWPDHDGLVRHDCQNVGPGSAQGGVKT